MHFRHHCVATHMGSLLCASLLLVSSAHPQQAGSTAADIPRLIRQLGSPGFAEREEAGKKLTAIGEPALERLRQAAQQNPDPEISRRAEALVAAIEKRAYRAVRSWHAHDGFVRCVAFSADGTRALSGGVDASIRLWDIASGRELRRFVGHHKVIESVAFCPDGRHLISGSYDGSMRLWDINTGTEVRRFEGHTHAVWSMAVSVDGRLALSGDGAGLGPGVLRVWDVQTARELRSFGHKGVVDQVAFSPDGSRLLSASIDPGDAYLHLWDAQSGSEVRSFREGHGAMPTTSAVFSTDGRRILSGSWDQTMRWWDVSSGRLLRHFRLPRYVYAVALTPDGRRALAGVGNAVYLLAPDPKYKGPGRGSIHVFDLAKGSEQHQFTSNSVVIALAVAPGGGYVLSGNFAGELELWRLPR